jgi:hypothetical protein
LEFLQKSLLLAHFFPTPGSRISLILGYMTIF